MALKLQNTLTREKEEFRPFDSEGKKVGFYGCGPTVYWFQHIGNMRRYVFEDILYRTLVFNGYEVEHVINVTDVGHLTSDEDTGEDKVEKAAKKEGRTAKEIADHYFNAFKEDLEKLNVKEPDKWPRASEHIQDQIDMIKTLEEKEYTYQTSDGVYFDTSKLEDYGKMANLNAEELEGGKRVDIGEKRNKTDFALWKFSEKPGERMQEWESPWGIGYPGWHIECSVMSSKYLGKQFDIHTGGMDHIQVHHTNEIAQSEATYDIKPWVSYWLHSGFMNFEGEKISKSTGGLYTLSDLSEKGYDPMEYRYLALMTHYRKPLVFSFQNLNDAKNAYKRLKRRIHEFQGDEKTNQEYLEKFTEAVNDDLNIPEALQVLWKLVRDENAEGKLKTIEKMDEVLGLNLLEPLDEQAEIPEQIQKLVELREKARKEKDFEKADKIRDEVKAQGYTIEDSKEGPIVKEDKE
ncbi:MAG: cysteine--tRNA ligase [Candidatus Pacearchaeota archaeon]